MSTEQQQIQFAIQRIYIKDLSFEAPHAPETFQKQWQPELNVDLNIDKKALDKHVYEVVLGITATVKNADNVAFIAEVKQSGIFAIDGVTDEQLDHLLGSYCPNILFPYAREAISDVVTKGSFPQLVLNPINFDAMYAEAQKEPAKEAETTH